MDEFPSTDNNGFVGAFNSMDTRHRRFAGLGTAPVAERRTVFFDENCAAHKHELHSEPFFMAVRGKPEHVFDANASPDIVVT
jgi:hypothetical protein